jgi:t-SNARE complex subunit (syntaxin)
MKLRHQELIEIENNIQELHDMFFDVANLIEFQV